METEAETTRLRRQWSWRSARALIAYWIFGVCNNYGYVVMLSAAYDILQQLSGEESANGDNAANFSNETRVCNPTSTGAILLADIIPSLFVKIIIPFLPFYIHVRMVLCVLLAAVGFLLVAFATAEWHAISGVVVTSLGSGLGEVSFLQYSAYYEKNVVSTWSSGTGAAGVLASTSYAALANLGLKTALLTMLVVPVSQAIAFWIVLPSPDPENLQFVLELHVNDIPKESLWKAFQRKIKLIPKFLHYVFPLACVYLFEYFINQGLFELITFDNIFLTYERQYHWLQVLYQTGVFMSRSSVNIIHIKKIWIMGALQFLNVIIYTCDALYYYIPNIWIVFALTLWEGTLGGAAYVNTYYRISHEVPEEEKKFAISITAQSDTLGITLAGFAALPAHDAICALPKPKRFTY